MRMFWWQTELFKRFLFAPNQVATLLNGVLLAACLCGPLMGYTPDWRINNVLALGIAKCIFWHGPGFQLLRESHQGES